MNGGGRWYGLRTLWWSVLVGGLGVLLLLSPPGQELEESFGLKLLFLTRGTVPPPPHVVVVNLDRNTANKLDLPEEPEKWPRQVYADLIRRLAGEGVELIGFDVLLKEPHDADDDARLAAAIAECGCVVLASSLRRDRVPVFGEDGEVVGTIILDTAQPPADPFAAGALAAAPFPIPKQLSVAKEFWLYMEGRRKEITLPVALLRAALVRKAPQPVGAALADVPAGSLPVSAAVPVNSNQALIERLTEALATDPAFPAALNSAFHRHSVPPPVRDLVAAVLGSSQHKNRFRFNHYGPPGTIPTISASRLLGAPAPLNLDLHGSVVIVGYSEDLQPDLNHGFYTFFSNSAADALSGVELAAEAFGNLLDGSRIVELSFPISAGIVIAWAFLLCGIALKGISIRSVGIVLVLSAAYLGAVYLAFAGRHLWVPFAIALWVQTPGVLLVVGFLQFRAAQRDRQKIIEAFGLYVPETVVVRMMTEGKGPHAGQGLAIGNGICLYSDAGQYTRVAEELDPMALGVFMNRYYDSIFPLVKTEGGFISDVVGDAVMALWAQEGDTAGECQAACRCALAVRGAVASFCRTHRVELPIRIGVNRGPFRLGNVGTRERLEYRASGDTVNTASRLENFCKQLGTSILVADEVIRNAPGFLSRRLGEFLLEGKSRSIVVHELLGFPGDVAEDPLLPLRDRFETALARFSRGDLAGARAEWQELLRRFPDDGPSQFYLATIQSMQDDPARAALLPVVSIKKV